MRELMMVLGSWRFLRCTTARRAYSMVELALVLAIIAIMAAVALPRMATSATAGRVEGAAESAAALVRTARQTAIATSTTVRVSFQANRVVIDVIDPATDAATDISDLLASRPQAERIISIGAGAVSALATQKDRERARARRAALVAIQQKTSAVSEQDSAATASRNELPWGAVVLSADFGGDASIVFNGHGVPDSGGVAVIKVGSAQRRVVVQAQTGLVEVTP